MGGLCLYLRMTPQDTETPGELVGEVWIGTTDEERVNLSYLSIDRSMHVSIYTICTYM